MVDPSTGYVYETEDDTPSGFYRFFPNVPGKLIEGGRLYMLKAINGPTNDDFGPVSVVGQTWQVEWVPISDPEAIATSTVAQGIAQGGAQFRRLEGCWWGDFEGLLPVDQRRLGLGGTGIRVRSHQRDHQAHLRLDDGQRSATIPTTSR